MRFFFFGGGGVMEGGGGEGKIGVYRCTKMEMVGSSWKEFAEAIMYFFSFVLKYSHTHYTNTPL